MQDDSEPAAKVSLDSIYNIVLATAQDVGLIKQGLPSTASQLADHETRLRSLERRVWLAVGGFGLIAAASPYLSLLFIH